MVVKKSLLITIIFFFSLLLFSQYSTGFDYHRKESGAISWNNFSWQDTRMLSLGGISLFASPAFSQTVNPALIPGEENLYLGFNASYFYHEAFQYWGLNQGVLTLGQGRMNDNLWYPGSAVGLIKLNKFCFSAGWYLSRINAYPDINYREDYSYGEYYSYGGDFSGKENTFFAAAAYQVSDSLSLGFKLDYISGNRDVYMEEIYNYGYWVNNNWVLKPLTILHSEAHNYKVMVPSVGIHYRVFSNWSFALSASIPLDATVDRELHRSFTNSYNQINISDDFTAQDPYYKPASYRLGTKYLLSLNADKENEKRLTFGAEAQYTDWSGYKFVFFDEEIPRELSSTLTLALGIEFGILSQKFKQYYRIGFRLDPQPVHNPSTSLTVFTGGMGIGFWKLNLDIGFAYFFTSGLEYNQKHFVTNGTLSIKI